MLLNREIDREACRKGYKILNRIYDQSLFLSMTDAICISNSGIFL